jgi:hypothetical protein
MHLMLCIRLVASKHPCLCVWCASLYLLPSPSSWLGGHSVLHRALWNPHIDPVLYMLMARAHGAQFTIYAVGSGWPHASSGLGMLY